MGKQTVYIQMPCYLRDWLRHEYWDAEAGRVEFPRGSAPRAVMQSLVRKAPLTHFEREVPESIPVAVPTLRGVNSSTHWYLTDRGRAAVAGTCRKLFQAQMWEELQELFGHDVQITDIIYDYMDRHGIDRTEKNWETIRQMYMRMRKKSKLING